MKTDLINYYRDRAKEYENIYLKPERRDDLKTAATVLQDIFFNKKIFEIGCGTGYWTEKIARAAVSVFATDINETVLEVARHKNYENANVTFGIADFNSCPETRKYENVFGGFIWSHIPLQDLNIFLTKINRLVLPGGTIVFMDNHYVEGNNSLVAKTDEQGNTFQTRKLEDGTTYLILKNFPSETFIMEQIRDFAKNIKLMSLKYYWILIYSPLNK